MVSMQVEENSPSPQPSPSPQCVGREFVRQYYTLLAEAPRYVHRFYSNESIFVHGTDTEETIGQTAIYNKIKDLSFEECRTRIRALDAHETLGKGVVVQVVGEISVNNGPMRRFVQTFVLAPQSEKKYYVHNDIFRYEDELFVDKLNQENGAPADPDAEKTGIDERPLPTISNGSTHVPDEIQNARYNLPQQPIPISVLAPNQTSNQTTPVQIAVSGYMGNSSTLPPGSVQQQVSEAPFTFGDNTAGPMHFTSTAMTAPTATSYAQQPLPQRSHQPHQQVGPPPPTAVMTLPAASLPLTQPPPPEPTSTTNLIMEQPPRPPSVDKLSPNPSEDHEESVGAKVEKSTWASRVGKGPVSARSPNQQGSASNQQQQQQHVMPQLPGTSAPLLLSPTSGAAPSLVGQTPPDFVNKPPGQQQHSQMHSSNRQQYNKSRPPNTYGQGGGGGNQDARSSPAPSGFQNFPSGGVNRQQSSSVDNYPPEQQIYVRNLPMDINDVELKTILESAGYTNVLEAKVRRKSVQNAGNANPNNANNSCFAFVAFDTREMAQKLIQMKTLRVHNVDIIIETKRLNDKSSGGGGGGGNNFQHHNGQRLPFGGQGMTAGGNNNMGRGGGGPNTRGGMNQQQRMSGGGAANRPQMNQGGQGGFYGQGGGGGGGNRPAGGNRTFHQSTGRGGGMPHQ